MRVMEAEDSGPQEASAGGPRDPMEEAAVEIRVEDAGAAAGVAAEEGTAAAEAAGAGAPSNSPPFLSQIPFKRTEGAKLKSIVVKREKIHAELL